MLSVSREPQVQQGGAAVQRSRSRLVRLLTSAKKTTTTTTDTNERSTSPPSGGSALRARPSIKRPPAAVSAFSKEDREAALRARGLLPPLPVKDLSQLEREQDNMIPVVSLPQVDEASQEAEGEGASAADLIKKQWEAKNIDEETIQRQRLQTFKFGGSSTTDLTASNGPGAVGDVQSIDTSDLGWSAPQGSDLPDADRISPEHPLKYNSNPPTPLPSTGGDNHRTEPPVLPDVLVSGSEDLPNLWLSDTTAAPPKASSPSLLPYPLSHPTVEKTALAVQSNGVTRKESTRTTATATSTSTSTSSIPPSLDSTSSRTLSSSSEELSLLAYSRASSELKDAATSSPPSIGGAGRLKGLPPIPRMVPGGSTKDIPIIIENGEDQTHSAEHLYPKAAAAEPSAATGDERTVKGDSPRTHFDSQPLSAELNDEDKSAKGVAKNNDDSQAAPPVPPRDRETVKVNADGQSPAPQLHFEPTSTHGQPLPSRKRGMTLDSSTTRSSSDSANHPPAGAPVRRKTLNPFKRGQRDRSVSPGRQDPGSTSPRSTFGRIGRSVVGSVLRPSRQQTSPSSYRSPYLQARPADDVSSLDSPPAPQPRLLPSSPRLGASRSQSPPASPSRRGGVGYAGIFQQQQQQAPVRDDAVLRQAVSPTFYSHGTMVEEASAIKDEEQRRVTEMAFLY